MIRRLAALVAHLFYRIERLGEPVPDGPLLLVANHPNALLDPALVLTTAGREVRFLAKSTLFGWHPLSPIVRAARAIPVYRRRDEAADTSRNVEMFTAVDDALAVGEAVCIFPEGVSHSTGRLEQLRTGAARIAIGSIARGINLAIVPVGLNFDSKMTFRSRATVAYGPPFVCTDLLDGNADRSAAVRQLTGRIAERLRMVLIEAEPVSDAALVDRIDELYTAARDLHDTGTTRLERRRAIAAGIATVRELAPERYGEILQALRQYDRLLRRFSLRDADVNAGENDAPPGEQATATRFAVREGLFALAVLPLIAIAIALFVVPYQLTAVLVRSTGQEPDAVASAKVLGGALVYGLWVTGVAVLAATWWGGAAGVAVAVGLPIAAVAGLLAIERELTILDAVRAWVASHRVRPAVRRIVASRRAAIADVLDQTYEWISSSSSSGPVVA